MLHTGFAVNPQGQSPAVELQGLHTSQDQTARHCTSPLCPAQGLLVEVTSWGSVGLQRFPIPLLVHFKLKCFPLAALSTLTLFLFQRHLGALNADGYTPEPVGEHL